MNAELLAWQIGRNIRYYSNRFGLTQKEVCSRMKCDRRFYQRIEVGKALTTVATLGRVADILSISIHDLMSVNKLILEDEVSFLNFDWAQLNSVQTAIWYRNEKFEILKINSYFSELVGIQAEQILGQQIFLFLSTENKDLTNIHADCESQGLTNFYFSYFKEHGHSFPLQIHPIPCFKISGEYLGSLSFAVPIRSNPNVQQLLIPFIEHLYNSSPILSSSK